MILHATNFKAIFSAVAGMWMVWLDEIEFKVRYIIGIDKLKIYYQEIEATDIEMEWQGDIIRLEKWNKLILNHIYDLYDPDHPRNLAKTVTVK